MKEQNVTSDIRCFLAFVIVFMIEAAQGETTLFAVDVHEQRIP